MDDHKVDCAIFLPSLAGGGAERVNLNLAAGFAEQGLRVDLLLAKAEGPYMNQIGSRVRLIDFDRKRVITTLPQLVNYLHRYRPATLLTALDHVNIVALWARRLAAVPTRVVVTVHNTMLETNSPSGLHRARLIPHCIRLFYPWADAVIAVSAGVADALARRTRLARDQVQVIYNPVVSSDLEQLAGEELRHPWFDSGGPPVILAIGRLTKQKNFPLLIQAFAHLLERCPARLLILGEGEERASLEAMVREKRIDAQVAMPGFVNNPYRFLSRADLFVLSSSWEGLPTVLIEALALGTPIVSTDCPSGPKEILDDGRFGRIVPTGNVEALAKAMEMSLQNRSNDFSREERRKQARLFSRESALEGYLKVLFPGGVPVRPTACATAGRLTCGTTQPS